MAQASRLSNARMWDQARVHAAGAAGAAANPPT